MGKIEFKGQIVTAY